ncbi:MAG: polysaccharide pyruvyl transferase family protein [Phycisphaerae bacterium]|nr:polysaccharide pyruvyl transferase family protein [Phycisphaerae bacterium]
MKKFLITGAALSANLGGPSLQAGMQKVLSKFIPEADYTLVCSPQKIADEEELARRYNVKFIPSKHLAGKMRLLACAFVAKFLGRLIGPKQMKDGFQAIKDADILIDTWGIAFNDTLEKTFRGRLTRGRYWFLAKMFGTPVVKYTSAFGPCEAWSHRLLARIYLNYFCDLIIARDMESGEVLKDIGVSTPYMVCPDTAFFLGVMETEKSREIAILRKQKPVIGISVSHQSYFRASSPEVYVSMMVDLIHHLNKKYSAHVLILPNEFTDGEFDDGAVAQEIYNLVPDADCEVIQTRNLMAEEFKGIVKECDAIVAARYHTLIASLSTGVPVLAIAWHHKYREALRLFKQQRWIVDILGENLTELPTAFDDLWECRDQIRKELATELPIVLRGIEAGAKRVSEILTASVIHE